MLRRAFETWLGWMERRGSLRRISRWSDEERLPYLDRYYLIRIRGRGLFLHRFWRSDVDGVHDHPWDNASLVLRGTYYEESADGTMRAATAGCFRWRQAEVFHRLHVPEGQQGRVWTLFYHGRRRRGWGFLPEERIWSRADSEYSSPKARGRIFPRMGSA